MNDAEISRRLALAIGWEQNDIEVLDDKPREDIVCCRLDYFGVPSLRVFDYRDPAIIWAVAERFDCFPSLWDGEGPEAWKAWCDPYGRSIFADTAAKAVALAVIKAHKGSKTS